MLQDAVNTANDQDLCAALQSRTTWADILDSISAARATHAEKSENMKERSLPKNRAIVATLDSLTAMIPEENGLSILRGGLGLVFKVGSRYMPQTETQLNVLAQS